MATSWLSSLPPEAHLQIVGYLDELRDLNSLLRVDRHFATLVAPILYRRAVLEDRGSRVLRWVAEHSGLLPVARRIIEEYGGDVNAPWTNIWGHTQGPLFNVLTDVDVAEYLISRGARVDGDSEGFTPLYHMAAHGSPGVALLELFLRHGADIDQNHVSDNGDEDYPASSWPPLVHALSNCADERFIDIAVAFVRHGADVNATDPEGGSALYYALFIEDILRRVEVLKLLLDYGADVDEALSHAIYLNAGQDALRLLDAIRWTEGPW